MNQRFTLFLRKNFALLLAFALPILLIVGVALSVSLPSHSLSTAYNFVYTSCTDATNYDYSYNCDHYLEKRYSVVGNALVVNHVEPAVDPDKDTIPNKNAGRETTLMNENYTAHIFLHDTAKNESREITLEEAQKLTLDSLLTSPDGVTVSSHYDRSGGDFFLFGGGSSSYGYYLTKGKARSKINLINSTDQYYYQNNFHFLGWVLPGRN